jgi:putative DNA primase/helicase
MLTSTASSSDVPAITSTATEARSAPKKKAKCSRSRWRSRFSRTQLGNAEYFAFLYRDRLRFDHRLKRWLEWDESKGRWIVDEEENIVFLAGNAIRLRLQAAVQMPNSTDPEATERNSEINWCVRSETLYSLKAVIALARSQKPISDSGKDWDTNPWLLGVANGVLDLKTGELRQGKSQDKITKFSPVKFNPDARCPRFDNFLREILSDDEHMVDWISRALGYSLTGSVKEEILFMPYGLGRNGKTKLIEITFHIEGDYAAALEPGALDRKPDHHLAEGMELMGARFAKSVETRDGVQLDEEKIKAWTGGDHLSARPLYKHTIWFPPTHKLWVAFNHKPIISDLTPAMWDRIRLIPFERNFAAEGIADLDLSEKLKQEAEGILNRLVEGCMKWQRMGLRDVPAKIKAATAGYEKDSNPLADFITDRCALGTNCETMPKPLVWKQYKSWCHENGQQPIKHKSFVTVLITKGCWEGRKPGTGERLWGGIALKPPFDRDGL